MYACQLFLDVSFLWFINEWYNFRVYCRLCSPLWTRVTWRSKCIYNHFDIHLLIIVGNVERRILVCMVVSWCPVTIFGLDQCWASLGENVSNYYVVNRVAM